MVEGHKTPNIGHLHPQPNPRGAFRRELPPFSELNRFEWCITLLEDGERAGKLFFSQEAASLFIKGNEVDTGKLIMLSTLGYTQPPNTVSFACSFRFNRKL